MNGCAGSIKLFLTFSRSWNFTDFTLEIRIGKIVVDDDE